jgi:hypothetical protein
VPSICSRASALKNDQDRRDRTREQAGHGLAVGRRPAFDTRAPKLSRCGSCRNIRLRSSAPDWLPPWPGLPSTSGAGVEDQCSHIDRPRDAGHGLLLALASSVPVAEHADRQSDWGEQQPFVFKESDHAQNRADPICIC